MVPERLGSVSDAGTTLRNSFARVVLQAHVLLCRFDFDANIKRLFVLNGRTEEKI